MIFHSQDVAQFTSFPFLSHTMPLASTLLIRCVLDAWVCWWIIIHISWMWLMSSTSSLKQYQYPFLLLEGPKSSNTSSSIKFQPYFKRLRQGLMLHKPYIEANCWQVTWVLLSQIIFRTFLYNDSTSGDVTLLIFTLTPSIFTLCLISPLLKLQMFSNMMMSYVQWMMWKVAKGPIFSHESTQVKAIIDMREMTTRTCI